MRKIAKLIWLLIIVSAMWFAFKYCVSIERRRISRWADPNQYEIVTDGHGMFKVRYPNGTMNRFVYDSIEECRGVIIRECGNHKGFKWITVTNAEAAR